MIADDDLFSDDLFVRAEIAIADSRSIRAEREDVGNRAWMTRDELRVLVSAIRQVRERIAADRRGRAEPSD